MWRDADVGCDFRGKSYPFSLISDIQGESINHGLSFGQALDLRIIMPFYSEHTTLSIRRRCISTQGEAERFTLLPMCKVIT